MINKKFQFSKIQDSRRQPFLNVIKSQYA